MRAGPRGSEERIITGYMAAVAVAVALFFAGSALDAHLHPIDQPDEVPFGATEAGFTLMTAARQEPDRLKAARLWSSWQVNT